MINCNILRDVREDFDMSQEDVAKILKVPRSTYSMWEIGISVIPLEYLCVLSDYYNYSIDYLLGLTDNRDNKIKKGFNINILGNNLKEIRIKNNLSQENIAELLRKTQPCIYKYEKGKTCISTINLYKFCKEFNISLSRMCGKE